MAKTAEKIHGSDSSMDFEDVKSKVFRLFGRERPVHSVLGGGRPADLLLWKDKKASAVVLGSATTIWVLFELMEYHLLSLACHCLIFSSVILFLWSKTATFINKSPPRIPEFSIPEDLARNIALSLRFEINRSLAALKEIASGRDLKKFLAVIAGLWILSIIGDFCSFITLLYTVFVLLHSVPLVYDKYEDAIDFYGEKVSMEIKKQYAVLEAKVLKQIPMGPSKKKKN